MWDHDQQPPAETAPPPPPAPQAPRPAKRGGGIGAAGGIVAALALGAAKLKALLGAVFALKWLLVGSKVLLSFGSMFVSVLFYAAAFGGWKIAIVFVLMIAVHELGHVLTFRNFGIPASLPLFIPGLGAFVSSPMSADPARNAIAALMGPVFGVLAAAACWGYGLVTHEPFWIACAYIGFFLNLFNLIPAFPFDGGRVAGAIDGRLWLLGVVLLLAYVVAFRAYSVFTVLILIFVLVNSVPRIMMTLRGQVDPTIRIADASTRGMLALFYFALIALAVAGGAATSPNHAAAIRT